MCVGKKASGLGLAHQRDRKHVFWQVLQKLPHRGEIKHRAAPFTSVFCIDGNNSYKSILDNCNLFPIKYSTHMHLRRERWCGLIKVFDYERITKPQSFSSLIIPPSPYKVPKAMCL